MSRGQYYDPWAKVGNAATNAMSTYLASRPNANEVAMAQADLAAKNALVSKYESDTRRLNAESEINNAYKQSQTTQLDNRNNAPAGMADIFRSIIAPVEQPRPPALASMTPGMVAPGGAPFDPSGGIGESFGEMQGPMPSMAAPEDVRNKRLTESMPELFANAANYSSGNPSALADTFMAIVSNMGGSGEQITNAQMGSGMDYANTQPGFEADLDQGYTLAPGNIRFDNNNKQVANAPAKPETGGMSFTTNPDGTVSFSEKGFGKAASNQLDKQLITLDGILQSIGQTKGAIESETGDIWKSTGITGAVGGSNIFGVMKQLPMISEGFNQMNLSGEDMTRIKLNRSRMEQTVNEAGRFIVNGPSTDRFSNDDRKAANDAITIMKAGTDDASAYAILTGLENTIKDRMAGAKDLRNQGPVAAGNFTPQSGVPPIESGWSDDEESEYQELLRLQGGM